MITLLLHLLRDLPFLFGGHRQLALENLALRQQLAVYRRTVTRPRGNVRRCVNERGRCNLRFVKTSGASNARTEGDTACEKKSTESGEESRAEWATLEAFHVG